MSDRQCSNTSCTETSCENCSHKQGITHEKLNERSSIKKVIGIVSGKGGVGKSFVTSSLASELAGLGYKVGIMDADITGPSIPKMFGIREKASGDENGIFPVVTNGGIKVISVNVLLENEDDPVIWRGPVLGGAVKQFWTDVVWGELDYLLIDMPPGTGDVPLTVFQSIPVDGIVIVTSPQDLVKLIVKKAYNMAGQMNIPVLGLVENYSYMECPDCGKKIKVFGESKIDETAQELSLKVLGRIPIMPQMAQSADEGKFDSVKNPYIEEAVNSIKGL
ncbi:MAG: Mrp/NBP35 family ATP-binding protein [Lachnospiraceae bacterium]|nr:Mrp/NBP35 family ATP-binding protein [Lachnospiraceae bacterium]MDE6254456.1 Mrp/NBP35 family ATP-binding protein [Lachnospiraceae bacterium]